MKTSISFLVLGLALFVGYLFYTPVPEETVDQFRYRLMMAGVKAGTLIANLRCYFQPGAETRYQTFGFLHGLLLPSPESEVQGSNVQARYTEFDGVRVLVYTPLTERRGQTPGLVYYHGGGFAFGCPKTYGPLTRYYAEQLDMVVVSVDYRLAPTHPFPASIDDGFKATKWFLQHAHEYGVDASRVAIGGDSAGGFMTAVVSQLVQDDPDLPDIKVQILFYPWTQVFDFNTPSHRKYEEKFGDVGLIAKPRMAEFLSAYLFGRFDRPFMDQVQRNEHVSSDFKKSDLYRDLLDHRIIHEHLGIDIEPSDRQHELFQGGNETLWDQIKDRVLDLRMSPLLRKDFKGLPAAFIATADLDSLRDDGIFYARRLAEAGVTVQWKNYLGAYHGIAAAGPIRNIPTGVQMVDDSIEFIRDNV